MRLPGKADSVGAITQQPEESGIKGAMLEVAAGAESDRPADGPR